MKTKCNQVVVTYIFSQKHENNKQTKQQINILPKLRTKTSIYRSRAVAKATVMSESKQSERIYKTSTVCLKPRLFVLHSQHSLVIHTRQQKREAAAELQPAKSYVPASRYLRLPASCLRRCETQVPGLANRNQQISLAHSHVCLPKDPGTNLVTSPYPGNTAAAYGSRAVHRPASGWS